MNSSVEGYEELAAALLRRGGVRSLPVPIDKLALRLGADRITSERLAGEEGRLELRGGEVVIVTSRDSGRPRQRFTIAHEIGHLVLADPRLELGALRPRGGGPAAEERFCDRLAESLLMPAGAVTRLYGTAPESLATLTDCARRFEVSAAAANLRLLRQSEWSRALVRFRCRRGRWTLASVTGWAPERRDSVAAGERTAAVLGRFALPGSVTRLWLPLRCGEQEWHFGAELWGREGWALALVDPARRRPLCEGGRRVGERVARNPGSLKLFYTLDDIDACILPAADAREGKDGQDSEHRESVVRAALAA